MQATLFELPSCGGEWEEYRQLPPGPHLAVCLVGALDEISDAELLEVAAAARRQASWAQARELAAVAELARRRKAVQDDETDRWALSAHDSVVEEVSAALTVTGNAAATLVHLAERLHGDLPGTREALEAGQIDLHKARVISDLSDGLPGDIVERVETAAITNAPFQTTGQLRRRIRGIVRRLAPRQAEERKRTAMRQRRLELWDTIDGTTDMALCDLDPAEAHAIFNKISAAAKGIKDGGDDRPLAVIRADLAKHLLNGSPLPDAIATVLSRPALEQPQPPAEAPVTAAETPGRDESLVETLATLADDKLTRVQRDARVSGQMAALPFLIARTVHDLNRQLGDLRDSWCQADADDHGHPGYRPTAAMRRAVQARHSTCAFPSCNQPIKRCDLDHTVPWPRGITCACNLAPLCRRHHRTKQTNGWRLTQLWPGLLIWVTPSGTWHIVRPDQA